LQRTSESAGTEVGRERRHQRLCARRGSTEGRTAGKEPDLNTLKKARDQKVKRIKLKDGSFTVLEKETTLRRLGKSEAAPSGRGAPYTGL